MDIHRLISEDLFEPLVEYPHEQRKEDVAHAPKRAVPLDADGKKLAVRNILRYVPPKHHSILAKEFADELSTFGHIYAFRFMPKCHLKVCI